MSTLATAFAQMDPRYRDHMDGRHGRWWLGALLLLVGVAAIVAIVWAIVATSRANRSAVPPPSATSRSTPAARSRPWTSATSPPRRPLP